MSVGTRNAHRDGDQSVRGLLTPTGQAVSWLGVPAAWLMLCGLDGVAAVAQTSAGGWVVWIHAELDEVSPADRVVVCDCG